MSVKEIHQHLTDSEEAIIRGCIAGDRSAQAALYKLYARRMLGSCMWYARNKNEAEEILQDGFLRIFTYIRSFSGHGSFEGWMHRIMVNAALSAYKNKQNQTPVVEFNALQHDQAEGCLVLATLDAKDLMKLVQTLTPAYRMVFNLFVLEGMKHREIAQILGISEGTSKSNLAHARVILQKKLAGKKELSHLIKSRS